ncbi:MAG: glycosyltransferase family 9 protein [Armatimonadetes bacterium]|nr:glycosyltransferase family 9 protein [Armatimonadota bacterium]
MGELVLQLPVLERLRRRDPGARVDVLGSTPSIQLLQGSRLIDGLYDLRAWGMRNRDDVMPGPTRRKLGKWVKARQYDAVLNVAQAPAAVRQLLVERFEDRCVHEVARPRVLEAPRLDLPQDVTQQAGHTLGALVGQGPGALVGLCAGAAATLRSWPLAKLARLADLLTPRVECQFLVFGPRQHEVADWLRQHVRRPERIHSSETGHLQMTAGLLSRCRVAVCDDPEWTHLAAALGVPTVAIFGPTYPGLQLPSHPWVMAVGGRSMDRVEAEDVMGAMMELLGSTSPQEPGGRSLHSAGQPPPQGPPPYRRSAGPGDAARSGAKSMKQV